MDKVIREGAVRVGVDLAKRVIQVHAVDAAGRVLTSRALPRDAGSSSGALGCLRAASLPWRPARVRTTGRESSWSAGPGCHGSSRRSWSSLTACQGASGKNDANDAAAICEAASRPTMRFIAGQVRRAAEHAVRAPAARGASRRTAPPASTASGVCWPSSGWCSRRDRASCKLVLSEVLEDASNELGALARLTLQRAQAQWHELDEHLAWCDERVRCARSAATLQVQGLRPR